MKNQPRELQFGKLLVPVDFSECSRSAVEFADRFAKCFGSEVCLVHVVDPYLGTGDLLVDMVRIQRDLEKEAKVELEKWANRLEPRPRVIICSGFPAQQIIEVASEIAASAIVISSHGRSAIARFFIGGVSEWVVRHARCPVIVLPWKKCIARKQNFTGDYKVRQNQRLNAAQSRRQYEQVT